MEVLRNEFGLLVGTSNLGHNVQNSCHMFSLNLGRCFQYKYISLTILHVFHVSKGFVTYPPRLPNTLGLEICGSQKPTQRTKPQQVFGRLGYGRK